MQTNRIDLSNRVAIVTGAARGIGYAISERLLQSGAAVSLWDLDAAALRTAGQALAEIAAMVAWLSSEECSFSTGQLFDISGGRSVY